MIGAILRMGLMALIVWCQPSTAQASDGVRAAPRKTVDEPASYRVNNYRAPPPGTIKGGKVVSSGQAMQLWQARRAIFFDVMPRAEKPKNLPKGTLWRTRKRYNIPGSNWLVDVGFGRLNKERAAYFKSNLAKATAGNRRRPVLFYCLSQCWMSWNAARRAIALGYENVYWYPDGTDGWAKIGGPLALSEPIPLLATPK